jgi:hypothetical protein
MNVKTALLNKVIEEETYSNLKVLRYTRKRPLYVDEIRTCVGNTKTTERGG